jgi:hypothetical protein
LAALMPHRISVIPAPVLPGSQPILVSRKILVALLEQPARVFLISALYAELTAAIVIAG